MKFKKIFCSLILVFCSVIFTGCVNVEYQRRVDDFGRILDKITIELNYNELTSKGYNEDDVVYLLNHIKEDLHTNYIAVIENRLKSLQQVNPIVYNSLRNKVDIGVVTRVIDSTSRIYKVSVEILFASSEVMQMVYGIENDESQDQPAFDTQVDTFITKYVQTSDNAFGDVTTLEFSNENLYNKYSALCPDFNDQAVTLTQIYGSTNDRLNSNADYVETIEGFKCHLWELSVNQAKDFQLEFYYNSPTTSNWYILALAISVFVVLILAVIAVILKYKKSKYIQKVVLTEQESDIEQSDE